ncbi:MAG: putative zinc-binding metallopeptidase [Fimbriimonas sp.]
MIPAWLGLTAALLGSPAVYQDADARISFDLPARLVESPMVPEPADSWRRKSAQISMIGAFARYPVSMLDRYAKAVYFSPTVYSARKEANGFYDSRAQSLVIALGKNPAHLDMVKVYRTFHHEFAHAIEDHLGAFPYRKWLDLNAKGFRYVGTSRLNQPDPALFAEGFYTPYCQTGVGEDFAVVASYVMSDDDAFWAACRVHPRLAAKARLMIEIYRRADPNFRLAHGPANIFAG